MNRRYSVYQKGFVGISVLLLLVMAVPHSANAVAAANRNAQTTAATKFCSVVATRQDTFMQRIDSLQSKVTTARNTQNTRLTDIASATDKKIATLRAQADTDRKTNFDKLEAKATTAEQKQAVKDFEVAVVMAVQDRRAAFDAARTTFRDGVKQAIESRRTTTTEQETTFRSDVSAAFSAAEASCTTNNNNAATIRQTLITELKDARTSFQTDRKSDSHVTAQIKTLITARNASFTQADQTFKTSLQSDIVTLKAAFGKDSSNI